MVRRIRVPQEFATPSLEVPQGTTEDALGNTVRTPVTRRFRRPLPMLGLVLVLGERVGVRGHRRPHRNEGLFRRIACP